MGLFDSSKKETTTIINYDTFLTNGHMVLVTTEPIQLYPALNQFDIPRYIIVGSPRDYPKTAKDYRQVIQKVFYLPVAQHCLLPMHSDYKKMYLALPNDPQRLPKTLEKEHRDETVKLIISRYTVYVVDNMYWQGIKDRDVLMKKVLSPTFTPDYNDFQIRLMDERLKFNQSQAPQMRQNIQTQGQLKPFQQQQ